jgi:hypothetical protein
MTLDSRGQKVVTKGLLLCKLHEASAVAFSAGYKRYTCALGIPTAYSITDAGVV